ncbi:MAG: oligosaccharide flippase family protein [Gallionella sp.]|nr:oligosaccharide flippase family protein [Gallionella sp.]
MQTMSLKKNILSSYVSQIYVTIIGIVMVPVYVKYMGAEAYGLVGFFAMLQAWFQLLDMGLTPTLSRETARYRGGATDAQSLRRLLRVLEGIFILVAIMGAAGMILSAGFIASEWLKVQQLPQSEVRNAIMLMAVIIALRWLCGLYRGAVTGFERLVWLSGVNIAIATARFVLVIPIFIFVGTSPTHFFTYQLVIAIIEVLVLAVQTYHLLPKKDFGVNLPWQWQPLKGVLRFSLSIAFTSSVWVLVTQSDKLILSNLLLLSDYAYFTLAVLAAGGILIVSTPISGALLPRMTKLNAEGDEAGLIRLYRDATQLVGIAAVPAALVLAIFSEQVLWAWTGDSIIASKAAPVLTLYALGNGLLALAAFPYYLQFAKGDLKLHLIGNALFVLIFIPLLIWAANNFGMVGAGYAWIIANLLPFIAWLPVVHRRFVKGLHAKWLLADVLPIAILPTTMALGLRQWVEWPESRLMMGLELVMIGIVLCVAAASASSWARGFFARKWHS